MGIEGRKIVISRNISKRAEILLNPYRVSEKL
jgi:hypothetical protein